MRTPWSTCLWARQLNLFLRNVSLQTVFKRNLAKQFSIAFDVYLSIRASVKAMVLKFCGRDTEHWRLKHACPPCTYQLHNEEKLKYSIQVTFDGNDSLKRMPVRDPSYMDTETGDIVTGGLKELVDKRSFPNDFILPPAVVDEWAKDGSKAVVDDVPPSNEVPPADFCWLFSLLILSA